MFPSRLLPFPHSPWRFSPQVNDSLEFSHPRYKTCVLPPDDPCISSHRPIFYAV